MNENESDKRDLERLTTNIVPYEGPMDARMVFIGQSPGTEENNVLKPFVGPAGQLLNRCLKGAGIIRSEVLITNCFMQQPPGNNVKYFFSSYLNTLTWEGQEHIDHLKRFLEDLLERREQGKGGPNVLVALGTEALWVLTGHKRITKWRGSVLPCTLVPGFKVYPTFHPSYVNRLMNEPEERLFGQKKQQQKNALPLLLADLQRAKEQSKFPEHLVPRREFVISASHTELIEHIRALNNEPMVAVDIETIRGEQGPFVWCIGFSPKPSWAFVVPIVKRGILCWTEEEEAALWYEISKVFLNPNVKKVFQNGGFDLSILGRYYGLRVAPGSLEDTMWAHQATYPDLEKGLHVLASIYTWEPYYKDDGKYWDGRRISDEAEFTYNARDCCVTREIMPVLEREAKVKNTWQNYQTHMKVFPSLLKMMIKGVRFDDEQRKELLANFTERIKASKETITKEAGLNVNLNSPTQLQRLLYGMLGYEIQYNHKTKKPSTDRNALQRLKYKHPNCPVLQALLDYRKFEKLRSTYATLRAESDSRIRTSYGFISTFRLSSSESHFGFGGNLQNIPVRSEEGKLIRKLFIPDPGKCFVASDLSQAEAREVAWLSGDLELINAFLSGIDVHYEEAKRIFQIPDDHPYEPNELFTSPVIGKPMKLKEIRYMAKRIVHAHNYGMGPRMLQTTLIQDGIWLEFSTCRQLLESAGRARPLKLQWQASIREEIRVHRALTTPLGDFREFRGRINDSLFRAAYAYKPQSTVGRLVELAIQNIHESIPLFDHLLNNHDEVIGQCLPEDLPQIFPKLRSCLEIPHIVNGRELIIPAEFKVGWSWGDLAEVNDAEEARRLLDAKAEKLA